MGTIDPSFGNALLDAITPDCRPLLQRHLELVELERSQMISDLSGPVDYLHFPTTALISLFVDMANGISAEVALIGNTGSVGVMALLCGARTPFRAVVDSSGLAYRIRRETLQDELPRCPELRQALMRYITVRMAEIAGVAVCNGRHSVAQRLCRALLIRLDRAPSQTLYLTHDMLAQVLGVHRPAVSEAAVRLKQAGAIDYRRGRLVILDRRKLLDTACECYDSIGDQMTLLQSQPR